MASNQQPSTSVAPAQEYIVRVSKDTKKKESILKFNPANNMDFTKPGKITMERENNFKEFKQANDVDMMPKFGAGSEFGREAREEARKKKYGMKTRVYQPDHQPWTLKVGNDNKSQRRFKGIKEGGVLENASYYIFTQCPDGAFEAYPVEEWYNFSPIARYKVLNAEEAEKEFERREKNVNYFNIMVRKRMRGEEDEPDVDEDGKKVQKKKSKDFMLTELDEWAILSNSDDSDGSEISESEKKPKKEEEEKKKKKKKKPTKKKRNAKNNSDEEALEDSDDLDEGKEVDYMTSSDSEDDAMFKDRGKVTSEKYAEKGVEEEDGLRKLINSDDDEEEEANKEEEEDKEEEDEANKSKESKKDGSDSESSSSSDSDSDVEKAEKDASALFLTKAKNLKKNKSNESTPTSSRSGTPTVGDDDKGKKRKGGETDSPAAKKSRVSTPTPGTTSTPSAGSSDGINDEIVRRYLMRKPMTTKELLIKFKHTGLSKEQRVTTLAQILKRLNPDKKKIKDQLYLSLKKPE